MNGKGIQALLWDSIRRGIRDNAPYSEGSTPQMAELKARYESMCDKFRETLSSDQQSAFDDINCLAVMVADDCTDEGVVLGLYLAKEMQAFLDRPADALRQANATYPSVYHANRSEITALEEYFRNRKGVGSHG